VSTSVGFRAEWEETACSIDLWADEVAQAAYARRCRPTDADLAWMVSEIGSLLPSLRTVQSLPTDARGLLFWPGVVEELIGRLLLPNLSGVAIRDGRSPFTRADLESGRAILRSDLNLVLDTTLPFELATAPCSPEGVPARRAALVAGGRLVSPVLNLASATDFGLPPTPAPRGRPAALLISHTPPIDLDAALALLDTGVVVRDLPGLHTQQPRRMRYAAVAPDAQVVMAGAMGGRCAVRLAGNLLDHLTQPSTRLVRISGELGVGLLVLTGGEVLPA
jgi:predicted Zn-dependent protease